MDSGDNLKPSSLKRSDDQSTKQTLNSSRLSEADTRGRKESRKQVDTSSDLPSINERLSYLRPSRELLEYYRKKIAEFDDEHDSMLQKLDQYKMTYEEQHKMQWEQRQREDEIAELQKALSDMQVYLFQEREHVLRLYAENDRLKIRELENHKKIQTLLSLSGLTENEVSYFFKEPPAQAVVRQKLPKKLLNNEAVTSDKSAPRTLSTGPLRTLTSSTKREHFTDEEEKLLKDNQALTLQVEALQTQMKEQTRLNKEQTEALLEDRRIRIEESDSRRLRDQDKLQMLTEKLHKTQELLYDSTRDFLTLRYEHRENEKRWMVEKDRLLQELDACHEELSIDRQRHQSPELLNLSSVDAAVDGFGGLGPLSRHEEFKAMEYQCKEAQRLADMYREQVIQLEDQLSKIREEGNVGKELFKIRSEKMAKHLEIMNKRYNELEKRRNLEVEGFKTDIKQLRTRLKDVEKQLYKITIGFTDDLCIPEQRPDDIDMQILRNVRRTASRSSGLMDELKSLKSKVYGLENDLRHL